MGGWAPLAVAASDGAGGSSALHWLHISHLGVPVGSYDASGNATSLTGITLLGFPGQTQTLADLYYNQYRDYDPTTGRYLQADPIGLAGDVNPYVYAGANPVGMVDPWGLEFLNLLPSDEPIAYSALPAYTDQPRSVRNAGLHVFAHGNPNVIGVTDLGRRSTTICMNADDFASWLRNRYDLRRFSFIQLCSCRTGVGDNSFAERFARATGLTVFAPNKFLWLSYSPTPDGPASWPGRGFGGINGRDQDGGRAENDVGDWRRFDPPNP